ncbi:MAG: DEAD/DEAH box helicase [Spirochaetales bacterium]|nr:DEAD/DEAH box helicase [Spirochaetales bacterium]
MTNTRPLIVQSDHSLLLEVHHPAFAACRDEIAPFAELEKSPEHVHSYRMTPLSLWNAASAGWTTEAVLGILTERSRYPVPENVVFYVKDTLDRWGQIRLEPTDRDDVFFLEVDSDRLRAEIAAHKKIGALLGRLDGHLTVPLSARGTLKQDLLRLGYPVQDLVPLRPGAPLSVALRPTTSEGEPFTIRDYQHDAVTALLGDGRPGLGYGTIVLPCGSGKTIVGLEILSRVKTNTLILTTNVAAVHQWIDELLDKTDLTADQIGEYTGEHKNVRPVTVATYQVLVWRESKEADYPHFHLFRERPWGLVIYDEVHMLPAPVFRVTAELQAVLRVGLTATLVREDGAEADVFSLVGPKRFDVPWKVLEAKGWIAKAFCTEIRIDLPSHLHLPYAVAGQREKFRLASENPLKIEIVRQLIENHREDAILVIGQYLDQLQEISRLLKAPLITGSTPNPRREELYADFRAGKLRVLVVSKVANFAINLPDASMAIQVSGSFGSRQEEAQRLGRILRPKERNSWFYSLVSRSTVEEDFSAHRQKFLTEQGYKYTIELWDEPLDTPENHLAQIGS